MTPVEHAARLTSRSGRLAARAALAAACAVAGSLALSACTGLPHLPLPDGQDPAPAVTPPPAAVPLPEADPEVIALADRMFLTEEGRTLFLSTLPELADAERIETACAGAGDTDADGVFTGGCFVGSQHRMDDRIYVFRPSDERLAESMVTVAAHELLHAAYARLSPMERATVDPLLAEATAGVPADDPIHEQIAWSTDGDDAKLATERFSYLGSQIRPAGGFAAELERVYARWFTDRAALVDTHHRASSVVQDSIAAADAAFSTAAGQESQNAQARAQLDADRRAYDSALAAYSADLAQFEATPVEERGRWEVTLRPVGAEPVTMSWEASLTYRHDELEGFRADLAARDAALTQAEASAAALRADAEQQRADAIALVRAANPNAEIED